MCCDFLPNIYLQVDIIVVEFIVVMHTCHSSLIFVPLYMFYMMNSTMLCFFCMSGLHPTNVRYEPAVYAVTPRTVSKDSTCIAMTRALGDFYAHQFGLTHKPSITVRKMTASDGCTDDTTHLHTQTHASDKQSFTVFLASDGVWDCWKYDDLMQFINDLLTKKQYNLMQMGESVLEESITRAITNFGAKHYDDACLVTWQFSPQHNNTDNTQNGQTNN